MPITPGTRLGPYEIQSLLGAGGMGEVYRARDTRLDRIVAVKVLRAQLAAQPELRQRFEREARAIAALNHPHICALYDIGHQDGIDFLVMEHLEGETLSQRLANGPMPAEQLLRCAIQMADALDKAHREGFTHRDLKPGNIMLTGPAARPAAKLLDFGLAKFGVKGPAPAPAGAGGAELPTQGATLTVQGTILGTVQYMSPEQLDGKDADARSDIFSFGAILYEMATGRKAFEGRGQASLIAAILAAEPKPMSEFQPLVGRVQASALDRAVRTCLAKDPDDRWQSARDLMRELQWLVEKGEAQPSQIAPPPSVPVARPRTPVLAWIVAAVAVVAALAVSVIHFREQPRPERPLRFLVAAPAKTFVHTFTLSPDGHYLAMAASAEGKRLLWLRPLDALEAQSLPGTDGAQYPFWSPDSRFLGFFAQGKLKKISVTGGPAQTLCDAPDGRSGAWNRDGLIVFAPSPSGVLHRVSAMGGATTPVTSLEAFGGAGIHRFPIFLPDGRHFLYLVSRAQPDDNGIYLGSLESKEKKRLLADPSSVGYVPGEPGAKGYLLFRRETTLLAQPFDPDRLQIAGEVTPVAEQVGIGEHFNHGDFSVSENGVLAYRSGRLFGNLKLTWFDRQGKQLGALQPPESFAGFSLSPDGNRVAVNRVNLQTTANDLWLLELARGAASRFTFDPGTETFPVWSPDGSRILFASDRGGRVELCLKASSGAGKEEVLFQSPTNKRPTDWSRDGRLIAFLNTAPKTRWDVWLLPMEGDRKPIPYLQTEFDEFDAQFSPDGRWMAYTSTETGRAEVYVQTIPASGGKWQISTSGGVQPKWRRDGSEILYLTDDRKLMAVTVKAGPAGSATFEAGVPRLLFETRVPMVTNVAWPSWYDLTTDGQRILLNTQAGEATETPTTVVVNWLAQLRR